MTYARTINAAFYPLLLSLLLSACGRDADDKKTTMGDNLLLKDEPIQKREIVEGVEVKIEIPAD